MVINGQFVLIDFMKVNSPVTCLAWDAVNRLLVTGAKQYVHIKQASFSLIFLFLFYFFDFYLDLYRLKPRMGPDFLELVRVFDLKQDFVY